MAITLIRKSAGGTGSGRGRPGIAGRDAYQGAWSATGTYETGDLVSYNGLLYWRSGAVIVGAAGNPSPDTDDGWSVVGGAVGESAILIGEHEASEETQNKIILNNDNAYLTERVITQQAGAQTAVFADYSNANYLGVQSVDPDLASFSVDQWYFNLFSHRPRVITDTDPIAAGTQKGWIDATIGEVIRGAHYRGEFQNDAEAAPHMVQTGDLYLDLSNRSLRIARRITAGAPPVYGYELEKITTATDIGHLSERLNNVATAVSSVETVSSATRISLANLERRFDNLPSGGTSIDKTTNPQVDAIRNQTNETDLAGINATAQALLDDSGYMTVRKVVRALQRVLKAATTSTIGFIALARNSEYDATESFNNTRAATVFGIRRILASAGFITSAEADTKIATQATESDTRYISQDTTATGSGTDTERGFPSRLAFLYPDGSTEAISVLTNESIRRKLLLPATLTTAMGRSPSPVRIQIDGIISGLTASSQITSIGIDGVPTRTIRTSPVGRGEYVGNGRFRLFLSLTNAQVRTIAQATSTTFTIQMRYDTGSGQNIYTHAVPVIPTQAIPRYIPNEFITYREPNTIIAISSLNRTGKTITLPTNYDDYDELIVGTQANNHAQTLFQHFPVELFTSMATITRIGESNNHQLSWAQATRILTHNPAQRANTSGVIFAQLRTLR